MRSKTGKLWLVSLLLAVCLPVAVIENRISPYSELWYYGLCVSETFIFGLGLWLGGLIDKIFKGGEIGLGQGKQGHKRAIRNIERGSNSPTG